MDGRILDSTTEAIVCQSEGVLAVLPMLLLLVACGGAEGQPEVAEWTLSAEPTLVIGEDGTPAGEFDQIRTALHLPGNELAVVDGGTSEIRIFDGLGAHQRTLGRQGAGPGEYGILSWVQLSGDTLVVYDSNARRITLLGLDGTVLGTILARPEAGMGAASPVARAADGTWVVRVLLLSQAARPDAGPPTSGVIRDSTGFGFLPASGSGPVSLVLTLPSQPIVMSEQGAGGYGAFTSPPVAVPVGSRTVVAAPAAGTLHWYGANGQADGMSTIARPRQPLASSTVDSIRQAAMDGASSPRSRMMMELMHANEAAPTELPAFRSVLADGEALLWLQEWQYSEPAGARYLVIGPDGSWRASVQMPERFTPTAIGTDWVLGIHRDEDGLQRVMRYGLERR